MQVKQSAKKINLKYKRLAVAKEMKSIRWSMTEILMFLLMVKPLRNQILRNLLKVKPP